MRKQKVRKQHTRSINPVFFQIAFRNVKKSAKDYFIYFFTIALGVAMFYSFNSIKDQLAAMNVQDTLSYVSFTTGSMAMVSIFVCFIIGYLIVYANRYLLKRRKKEMGIYLTLGMRDADISNLLWIETICIGVLAILIGLPIGVLLSQGLMQFSAHMMDMKSATSFFLSPSAMIYSVIFFFLLFLIVHHFNKKEIRNMELIALLKADKQNEHQNSKSFLAFLEFLLSLIVMAAGYYFLMFDPLQNMMSALGIGVALISFGTILFFLSISTIVLRVMEKRKRYYYKGLNMFVLRQISSKMKSSGLSMAVICILLFLSVSAMSAGPMLGESSIKGTDQSMPYDAAFTSHEPTVSIKNTLQKEGFPLQKIFKDYGEMTFYYTDTVKGKDFMTSNMDLKNAEDFIEANLSIISLSDYNESMRIQNKEPISLGTDEFIITYNMEEYQSIYQAYKNSAHQSIQLNGYTLQLKPNGVYKETLQIENVVMNNGTLVVPDAAVSNLTVNRTMLYGDFRDKDTGHSEFVNEVRNRPIDISWTTQYDSFVEVTMANMLLSYVGLYLGLCFIITAGAVLALQQLSQAADNEQRFRTLQKLGAKKKLMIKAVRSQVITYFAFPFLLALLHFTIIIIYTCNEITNMDVSNKVPYIIYSAGSVLLIYGLYFISTYLGSRHMIMDVIKNKER